MKTLICPTCNCSLVRLGIAPDKAATYSHNGEKLYFCCQGCADVFIASTDPQKYLDEIKDLIVCPSCLGEKPPELAVKLEIARTMVFHLPRIHIVFLPLSWVLTLNTRQNLKPIGLIPPNMA